MSECTIAKLQRAAEKRSQHLVGVLDKNDALRYEVEKLTRALIAIHRLADDPKVVKTIVEKNIPQRLRRTRGFTGFTSQQLHGTDENGVVGGAS